MGTVAPGNSTYQLAYYPDKDSESVTEEDYWIVKTVNGIDYSFQNAATGKYIRYNAEVAERSALVMSDSLWSDKSTLFTLEHKPSNNVSYYVIRPLVNNSKAWDRRTQIQGSIYPVGIYAASGAAIQCYVFHDAEGVTVTDDGKVPLVLPTTSLTLGAFANYMSSLTINGKTPAVDTKKKEFYVAVPEDYMNLLRNLRVTYNFKNSAYKLYINDYPVTNGSDSRCYVSTDNLSIVIKNGTTVVASGSIVFTCLPIVQLYTDTDISAVYSLGRVTVSDGNDQNPTEIMLSNLRVRGDYASRVEKKSYSLKLKDVDGETPAYRSFVGLRSDNNWILDAMFIDPARMRNRVSTDLWLDYSKPTYYAQDEPAMINGTHGRFVEVFLNDSYNGLYCLTEKIDRKQLNLKKLKYSADSLSVTQRGALYKASSWSIGTHLGNPNTWGTTILPMYNNQSETWTAFDVKYPDLGDGEPINWKPAYDAVKVPYWETSDAEFSSKVATYFDLPVFLDYYLFLDVMLASDNHGKNYYLSVYDQTASPMVSLTPWDLDGVWGRRWEGTINRTYAAQSLETYIINNEPKQNNLYLRMMAKNTEGFNDKLKSRYRELRGNYFSHTSLMNRFYNYNNLFKLSGADKREKTRWAIGDFDTEMQFLSGWITARLAFLDKQYLGAPYTGFKNLENIALSITPNPVRDRLVVNNVNVGEKIQIFSMQGNLLLDISSAGDKTIVNMQEFEAGIYLIKAGNAIAKIIKE